MEFWAGALHKDVALTVIGVVIGACCMNLTCEAIKTAVTVEWDRQQAITDSIAECSAECESLVCLEKCKLTR